MKKSSVLIVSIVVIIIIATSGMIYSFYSQIEHSWSYPGFLDKQPYSSDLFQKLVENRSDTLISPTSEIAEWPIDSSNVEGTLLYYHDDYPYPSYEHMKDIDSLVRAGAHYANISTGLNDILLWRFILESDTMMLTRQNLYYPTSLDSTRLLNQINPIAQQFYNRLIPSDQVTLQLANTDVSATFSYVRNNDTLRRESWNEGYIHKSVLDTLFPSAVVTSHVAGSTSSVTSFDIPLGKGVIHISLIPAIFTNYAVANPDNFAFASRYVESWPSTVQVTDSYYPQNDYNDDNNTTLGQSPLHFILSFPTLRWAWYLLLISLLLFILFRTQRKERIVPIIKGRTNQSLEFAKSLGTLKFKTAGTTKHGELGQEMFRQFRIWAKRRFRNNGAMDADFKVHLIGMLPEQAERIETLFYLHHKCETAPHDVTTFHLSEIYSITRYIYSHV